VHIPERGGGGKVSILRDSGGVYCAERKNKCEGILLKGD